MSNTISMYVTMETTTCAKCHMPFAFPDWYMKDLKETGKGFHCPAGHPLAFNDSELEKIKKEFAIEKQKSAQLEADKKKLSTQIQTMEMNPAKKESAESEKGKASASSKGTDSGISKDSVFNEQGREAKAKRVAELRKEGRSITDIAKDMGIPSGTASHLTWLYQIKADGTMIGKRSEAAA